MHYAEALSTALVCDGSARCCLLRATSTKNAYVQAMRLLLLYIVPMPTQMLRCSSKWALRHQIWATMRNNFLGPLAPASTHKVPLQTPADPNTVPVSAHLGLAISSVAACPEALFGA